MQPAEPMEKKKKAILSLKKASSFERSRVKLNIHCTNSHKNVELANLIFSTNVLCTKETQKSKEHENLHIPKCLETRQYA
jgi:uncharacterized protein involved in tellurium resistance